MIKASINIKDEERLLRAIKEGNEDVIKDSMKLIEDVIYKIEYEAYQNVPIDQGHLAASIRSTFSKNKLIGNVVARGTKRPYAAWVEYGTIKTPAQPFIVPAATKFMYEFFEGAREIVRRRL